MVYDWMHLAPHMVLAGAGIFVITLDLVWGKLGRALAPWLTIAAAAAAGALALRAWGPGAVSWGGALVVDSLYVLFGLVFSVALILVTLLSLRYWPLDQERKPEYFGLLLLVTAAVYFMASSLDLILIYVAIEFSSILSYVLAGYLRRNPASGEAGLKYFLYGASASAVMLLGFALLYGMTGTTNLVGISEALPELGRSASDVGYITLVPGAVEIPGNWALFLAAGLVLVGLGYKISAVPFHMWAPDAYNGAPTPIAAFLSVASKASGFAVLLRFVLVLHPNLELVGGAWTSYVSVLAVLSMVIGSLIGIVQNDIRRLLAYSSIAHAGFILLGVVADTRLGYASVIIYLVIYAFMNIGAFGLASIVGHITGGYELSDYSGLGRRRPILAALLAVFLLSLAGIPPLAGFFAKFYVLAAIIQTGHYTLAVIAILMSVVGLFLYARVLKAMYFDRPEEAVPEVRRLSWAGAVAMVLCFVGTLAPGVYPQPLVAWAKEAIALIL
ncbi:MAG: NADH-quinone oxidoreductase subunit N [Candidatus Coatesbacteria bacterium]|nr:MAG: NADH-quinone oxidoreductase subunit N [Candidatus Coatesbacteria bacterium]